MFLSCGDALFDVFVADAAADQAASNMVLAAIPGGSPLNVAVGLSRLEHKAGYFTKLSNDLFGQRLRLFMRDNKIDTSHSVDTDLNTTLAIVELGSDGAADYVFYTNNTADVSIEEQDLPLQLPPELNCIHVASYSTAVEPTASSLLSFVRRESASRIISYDPNLRTSIEPDIDKWRECFKGFASTANLIKASDEDILSLLGENAEDRFVADCFSHGAELVYITRGADGASAFSAAGQHAHFAGIKVDVVDTVGAGDTFQAAILHWLASENHLSDGATLAGEVDLQASMQFAIRAAAITCSRKGADLPRLDEL